MSPKQAKTQAAALRAQQKRNARQMGAQQALNAKAQTSGEMDADAVPSGSVLPVEVEAVTTEGFKVKVTVYEATYNGDVHRAVTHGKAMAWLADQRAAWKRENGIRHNQLKARARMERLQVRMRELMSETTHHLDEATKRHLADSLAHLGAAIGSIV